MIILSNFKKLALEIYRGNDFKFDLKKSFIKNLYYRWKKDNILFTKFSVFSTNKTLSGEIYMREYLSKSIYKNNNNDIQIQHEHIIFIPGFPLSPISTFDYSTFANSTFEFPLSPISTFDYSTFAYFHFRLFHFRQFLFSLPYIILAFIFKS